MEFTIRKVGRLTGGVFDLKAGDTLFMRGPYGNAFPVDQFENKDLLVICGGTGTETRGIRTPDNLIKSQVLYRLS